MEKSLRLVNLVAALLSLCFLLPNLTGYSLSTNHQWWIFGVIMLLTGLPHGATDHLVYKNSVDGQMKNGEFWAKFLFRYFVLMLIYGICWYLFPSLSLIIFLAMSFFHFGQSEFFYIKIREGNPLKLLLYFCWGALILLAILHFNFSESIALISEITSQEATITTFWNAYGNYTLATLAGICCLLFMYFLLTKKMKAVDAYIEMALLLLLIMVFYYSSLLLSFVVYFGIWHAVKAIYFETRTIQFSLKQFAIQALPFTLISIIGIVGLVWVSRIFDHALSPLMLFFIAISVLTLPHMTFMAILYNRKKKVRE